MGFALPAALLPRRCALTAPFHPYRDLKAEAVYFLWHFPSNGLEPGRPGRYPAHCSAEFGLSSPCARKRRERPSGPAAYGLIISRRPASGFRRPELDPRFWGIVATHAAKLNSDREQSQFPEAGRREPDADLMNIAEAIRIALRSLWANKLRSVLTLLGVVIGIAAVIAVVTFVSGIQDYVADKDFQPRRGRVHHREDVTD